MPHTEGEKYNVTKRLQNAIKNKNSISTNNFLAYAIIFPLIIMISIYLKGHKDFIYL
jgi:hypothetical protein